MNKIITGHWLADAGDFYLPIGFIPDYFRMCDIDSAVTNCAVTINEWFRAMETHEATGSQEGWALGLATLGYTTLHSDDQGISAYDTASQGPTVTEWTKAVGDAAVARNASAGSVGTYVKCTVGATDNTGGVCDRGAIFECVYDGTSASTEPTAWPSAVGGQVTDGTTIWEKVNTAKFRQGYKGVTIRAEIQTNTHECYYLAIMADNSIDHGDVDPWPSGVDTNWS